MKRKIASVILLTLLLSVLSTTLIVQLVTSWSNGGYSADPDNPEYGTHDWVAQHALDWLPTEEKQYILANLAAYLYGTELPDNPAGIGDTVNHHIYYLSNESLQDDASAVRAYEEYNNTLNFLRSGDLANASKTAGVMSHYIVDVAVFGHVMGGGTDWGAETHHSDYESYVNQRTDSYSDEFNVYLSFDGELSIISAYDAAKELAYDTTFDSDGDLTCVWMDQNYNWTDTVFKDRCGESLNLAVNYLADTLHTLYVEASTIFWKWLDRAGNPVWLAATVPVSCSYPIENLSFNRSLGQISFNITSATSGFCNVTVPKPLMDGAFRVLINETQVPSILTWNKTHTFIYFTYTQGTHNVKIIGEIVTRLRAPDLLKLVDVDANGIVNILDILAIAVRFGWEEDC